MSIAQKISLEGDEEKYASEQRLNAYKLSMSEISRMFTDSKKRRRMEKVQTSSEITELKLEVEALRRAVSSTSATPSVPDSNAAETTPAVQAEAEAKTAEKPTNSSAPKPAKAKPTSNASQRRSDRKNKMVIQETEEIMSDVSNIFNT